MSKKAGFKKIKKINLNSSHVNRVNNLWMNKRKVGINNTRKGTQSWCRA